MATATAKKRSSKKQSAKPKSYRPKKTAQSGVIRADEVLTIDAFCARMVCKLSSVAEMRKRGLVVRQDGANRLRIHGADYLEYVRNLPPAPTWSDRKDSGETQSQQEA